MDVYIHIGTEKTGTTSLQSFFRENRTLLSARGVCYPASPGEEKHFSLSVYCRDDKIKDDLITRSGLTDIDSIRKFKRELPEKIRSEILSVPGKEKKLIFSSEHLSSRLLNKEEIQQLKELVTPYSDNPKIVIYLRRQDEFLISSYSTSIKSGGTNEFKIPSVNKRVENRFNYFTILEKWREVFGLENMIVRVYDRSLLVDGDIINDFLSITGIPVDESFNKPVNKNESLNYKALEFLRRFNPYVPPIINSKLNPSREGLIYALANISLSSGKLPVDKKKLKLFYQYFKESNKKVAEKYLRKKNGILFKDGPELDIEDSDEKVFELEDAMEICAELWKNQHNRVNRLKSKLELSEAELAIRKYNFSRARFLLRKAENDSSNNESIEQLKKLLKKKELRSYYTLETKRKVNKIIEYLNSTILKRK